MGHKRESFQLRSNPNEATFMPYRAAPFPGYVSFEEQSGILIRVAIRTDRTTRFVS